MSLESAVYFTAAVAALFLGHVVRAARHAGLFPDLPDRHRVDLLLALAVSDAANVLLPFHLGEAGRVAFVAVRCRLPLPSVAATIAAERLSDIVVVAFLSAFVLLTVAEPPSTFVWTSLGLGALGLAELAGLALVQASAAVRGGVWRLASVFNERIRLGLVDTVWSVAQIVGGGALLRRRYLLLSALMWGLLLLSYSLFTKAVGGSMVEVSHALLGAPQRPLLVQMLAQEVPPSGLALLGFTLLPVVAVLAYGLTGPRRPLLRSFELLHRFGFPPLGLAPPSRGRFQGPGAYEAFLRALFSGSDQRVSAFGTTAIQDAVVHKLLPGGSDAIAALVEADERLMIRKCAHGAAAAKLRIQAVWLRTHAAALPLAAVIGEQAGQGVYCYDMPCPIAARDYYEFIHTAPVARSERILLAVVARMHAFHAASARGDADQATVDAYLAEKVVENARTIVAFARMMFPDGAYTINGQRFDLDEWSVLFDLDWLRAQITRRAVADLHGDLTVENIIVTPGEPDGWYLIDPNPANVFDTPLLDWAKLMQSLNLGYESLNRAGAPVLDGAAITLLFTRSSAYTRLCGVLATALEARLGPGASREIAFHELVHYLRLTPYKIRHAPAKALTFFACTSLLLRRYRDGHTVADGHARVAGEEAA